MVVVAYNEERHIRRCLESLRSQSERDFETIVVDNASTDRTGAIIDEEFPEVSHVRLPENVGFALGNNEGFRRARGSVVVLLNADAWAPPPWLEALLGPLREGPDTLACTHSPILNEGPAYATSTAVFDPTRATLGTMSVAGRNCTTPLPFDEERVFYGSGAALAVRKSAVGEVLFDPDYFIYSEDTALGWKLRLRGFTLRMVSRAFVHHALPPEGRPSTPKALRAWERNRLFNLYIYYAPWTRWLLKPLLFLDLVALALPKGGKITPDGSLISSPPAPEDAHAQRDRRKAVVQGVLDALIAYPSLRKKYREVQHDRRVPDIAVTPAMTARLVPLDRGLFGLINRFSLAWCRAWGIVTVETPTAAAPGPAVRSP